MDQNLGELKMKVFPVKEGQILEIDTVHELNDIRERIRNRKSNTGEY